MSSQTHLDCRKKDWGKWWGSVTTVFNLEQKSDRGKQASRNCLCRSTCCCGIWSLAFLSLVSPC